MVYRMAIYIYFQTYASNSLLDHGQTFEIKSSETSEVTNVLETLPLLKLPCLAVIGW